MPLRTENGRLMTQVTDGITNNISSLYVIDVVWALYHRPPTLITASVCWLWFLSDYSI